MAIALIEYDPLDFDDMVDGTQDEADMGFEMLWDAAADEAEDQSDEDGYGNPMPKSDLEPGATLPDFLRQP